MNIGVVKKRDIKKQVERVEKYIMKIDRRIDFLKRDKIKALDHLTLLRKILQATTIVPPTGNVDAVAVEDGVPAQ